ncbi:heat shock cognate 70 kDa protein [Spatholobus suberectus]|nr:heat shock cognate 70 kDa protein [Spatholobus suberectus]
MAMGPERPKPLHDFSMPCLKWGNQRFLRCVQVSATDDPNDFDTVRQKLMIDLKLAADNLKVSFFREANPKPWNLRTRRAACKAPHHTNQLDSVTEEKKNKNKKMKMEERAKFSVSLSKEEVELDFWALLGTRPPRRPKKRPRIVQKNLDTLFPGLWLTEVSAESYKVPDAPE